MCNLMRNHSTSGWFEDSDRLKEPSPGPARHSGWWQRSADARQPAIGPAFLHSKTPAGRPADDGSDFSNA